MANPTPDEDRVHTLIPGGWLWLVRGAWIAIAILLFGLWLLGTIANTSQPLPVCSQSTCDPFSLSAEDMAVVQELELPANGIRGFWAVTNIVIALPFFVMAVLIFWRRSEDWLALLVAFTLIYLGSLGFTESDDALLRMHQAARVPALILQSVGWTTLLLLLFVFPDGRFVPSGRIGWVVALMLLVIGVVGVADTTRGSLLAVLASIVATGFGMPTQIYRHIRISGPVQRQQAKWVIVGLGSALSVMILWTATSIFIPPDQGSVQRLSALIIIRIVIMFLISGLPVSIAISILRYRLWDIDVIIRRTLVYSASTVVLALIYAGLIAFLQRLFRLVTGSESPLAVVASTLMIAALFAPLRRRVQDIIDRRFYRRRYDAERMLAAFSELARDEVDVKRLRSALVGMVDDAFKPQHISLWLREIDAGEERENILVSEIAEI